MSLLRSLGFEGVTHLEQFENKLTEVLKEGFKHDYFIFRLTADETDFNDDTAKEMPSANAYNDKKLKVQTV